jgi:hypothetical protein
MDHAYWGPQCASSDIGTLISARHSEIALAESGKPEGQLLKTECAIMGFVPVGSVISGGGKSTIGAIVSRVFTPCLPVPPELVRPEQIKLLTQRPSARVCVKVSGYGIYNMYWLKANFV